MREYGFDDAELVGTNIRARMLEHGMDPDKLKDGIILGSGLGSFADKYMDVGKRNTTSGPLSFSFDQIFENHLKLPASVSGVAGHKKELLIGPIDSGANLVIAQNGREHPYEGIDLKRATFWLRVMQVLGIKTMVGSNAAGILTPKTLAPPALMLVTGDQDETGQNPLAGPQDDRFGPRFPHKSDLYPEATRALVRKIAGERKIDLKEGLLLRIMGPSYESVEDTYRLRAVVNDIWEQAAMQPGESHYQGPQTAAVGMSSTYETMVMQHAAQSETARAFDQARAHITVATDYAGSLGPEGFVKPLDHVQVQQNAEILQEKFSCLVKDIIGEFMKSREK